ncbi:hypothetical protein H0H81_009339 [Sphagnurus paluster]|uniref:Uncharacterized protein n=1 Tax=Sphagnurus paluster TaxID=117069 RepID=A0A9P7GMJ1_9AGAR|nr:hypothetical protein H0H81_009339 [Sphagnurus paluster]
MSLVYSVQAAINEGTVPVTTVRPGHQIDDLRRLIASSEGGTVLSLGPGRAEGPTVNPASSRYQ